MNKQDIQILQDHYNQWCKLLPELEKSLEQWKKAQELLTPLSAFYGSETWRRLFDSFDEPLDTQGNYSILSEDALWNALTEHYELCEEMSALLIQNNNEET